MRFIFLSAGYYPDQVGGAFRYVTEVTERLAACAPANALLVTESGVFTPADARRLDTAGARAMLVGESLMRQQDVEAATRALIGS